MPFIRGLPFTLYGSTNRWDVNGKNVIGEKFCATGLLAKQIVLDPASVAISLIPWLLRAGDHAVCSLERLHGPGQSKALRAVAAAVPGMTCSSLAGVNFIFRWLHHSQQPQTVRFKSMPASLHLVWAVWLPFCRLLLLTGYRIRREACRRL